MFIRHAPRTTLFPYTTLFRSRKLGKQRAKLLRRAKKRFDPGSTLNPGVFFGPAFRIRGMQGMFRSSFPGGLRLLRRLYGSRSEEHTSELQSLTNLVCRLLLEK